MEIILIFLLPAGYAGELPPTVPPSPDPNLHQDFLTPFEIKFPLFSHMGGEGVSSYFEDDVMKRNDKATGKESSLGMAFIFF